VPDFVPLYGGRLAVLGSQLLLARTGPDGEWALRLYDVPTGKDVWEKKFPAQSRALKSDDPGLAGAVAPDGRVTVVDARTGKELLTTRLKPEDTAAGTEVRLLQDRAQFYLVCSRPSNPMAVPVLPQGVPFTSAQLGSGLRTVPANGKVYALDRATGQERWEARLTQQKLFVDDFADLPVLLFASYSPKFTGGNQFVVTAMAVTVISKRTGKLLYDEPDILNGQPFHTLRRTETGTVELVSATMRIALSPER
jgi:outer membrane protein assembly factor BamB